jgi:transcriptional regulator GlxA family with amidase domain
MLENLRADLSVGALADRVGMSPRHFSRICLREMKMNPGQFVDRLRVIGITAGEYPERFKRVKP